MKKVDLIKLLREHDACNSAIYWLTETPYESFADLWNNCEIGEWMLWDAEEVGVDRRLTLNAACDITDTVLRHVPDGDDRPRIANETRRRYANGDATEGEWTAARTAARTAVSSAAWSADCSAVSYAARQKNADIVRKWIDAETIIAAFEKSVTNEEKTND